MRGGIRVKQVTVGPPGGSFPRTYPCPTRAFERSSFIYHSSCQARSRQQSRLRIRHCDHDSSLSSRLACTARKAKTVGLPKRGAGAGAQVRAATTPPLGGRRGIEERIRIRHSSAQRRLGLPVAPDDMRVSRGTTMPHRRHANPAVGQPEEERRPAYEGRADHNFGRSREAKPGGHRKW